MSFRRITNYMIVAFAGGLGLFNSSKLEIRQATDTNAELLFQNGQIVSSAIIFICISGILCEILVMKSCKGKTRHSNSLITSDDNLSATEFYDKHIEDSLSISKTKKYRRAKSKKNKPTFGGAKTNSANDIGNSKKKNKI